MFMRAVQFALARCPNMITDQDLRVEVHFFPGPSLVPSAEASTDENSVRVEPVGVEAEATRDMFDFLLEGF